MVIDSGNRKHCGDSDHHPQDLLLMGASGRSIDGCAVNLHNSDSRNGQKDSEHDPIKITERNGASRHMNQLKDIAGIPRIYPAPATTFLSGEGAFADGAPTAGVVSGAVGLLGVSSLLAGVPVDAGAVSGAGE